MQVTRGWSERGANRYEMLMLRLVWDGFVKCAPPQGKREWSRELRCVGSV